MDLRAGEPPPACQCLPRPVSEGGVWVSWLHLPQTQVLGQKCGGWAQRHHDTGAAQVSSVLMLLCLLVDRRFLSRTGYRQRSEFVNSRHRTDMIAHFFYLCTFEAPESSQLAFTPPYLVSCRHKEAYTWTNPMCCVHNIILGKLWIEQYGTVEITNHRYVDLDLKVKSKHVWFLMVDFFISLKSISTGDKCVLNFRPCSMFGKELHRVEGHIQDRRYEHVCSDAVSNGQLRSTVSKMFFCRWISKKKRRVIYGKWTECMYSTEPRVYETCRKLDKRASVDYKKLRTVSRAQVFDWRLTDTWEKLLLVCFWLSLTCFVCLAPSWNLWIVTLHLFSNDIFSFHNNMQWL